MERQLYRTKPQTTSIIRAVCLSVCLCPIYGWAESSISVIAHPEVAVQSLSRDSVWSIFGMRTRVWPNGQKIKVFVLDTDHPVHRQFTTDVLGTYPYQLNRIWKRLVFSGTGRAPVTCSSLEEMTLKVRSTPGAIGYITVQAKEGEHHVISVE